MRIIVTGSREWTDKQTLRSALDSLLAEIPTNEDVVIVHGACPRGADQMADEWARHAAFTGLGVTVEPHPADWKMGKQAGHWRNQHMVNLGADMVLAFFHTGAPNRGTADCVRRAEEAGIPVRRYPQPPTPEQIAAWALEPDDVPKLIARRDELARRLQ